MEFRDYLEQVIGCGHIKGDAGELLLLIDARHENGSELTVEEVVRRYVEARKSQ